jgi:hypothetical protein
MRDSLVRELVAAAAALGLRHHQAAAAQGFAILAISAR